MKLERRGDGGPVEPAEETPAGKKPVVVYIMVLFIAAFLLMAWSFASHQRSNTEALGKLQSSVTVMQEVQGLQDQVIELQKELAEAQKSIEALEDESAERQLLADNLERKLDAMELLYTLQQQYSARDYEACRQTIAEIDEKGYGRTYSFPRLEDRSVTSPEERYQQLKEAVETMESLEESLEAP